MISLEKDDIPLENYVNPLAQSHIKFLVSDDHRGLSNPSQTRKDIMNNLGKSLRQIHETMKHQKHLDQEELYEIFNAVNLEPLFDNLVKKTRKGTTFIDDDKSTITLSTKHNNYDFRSAEIARMMFETSMDYLLNSLIFKNMKNVKENINKVSDDFKVLSMAMLEKNQPNIKNLIGKDKESYQKTMSDIDKLSNVEEKLHNELHKLGIFSSGENSKKIYMDLINLRNEITSEIVKLQHEIDEIKKKQKKSPNDKIELETSELFIQELRKGFDKIDTAISKVEKLNAVEFELYKTMNKNTYGLLANKNYYSPKNQIHEIQSIVRKPEILPTVLDTTFGMFSQQSKYLKGIIEKIEKKHSRKKGSKSR